MDGRCRSPWRAACPCRSWPAGPIGGAAHIAAVASAWAYDLWLKTTTWSCLPYMVSFGLVVPFLTYGLTPPQPPAPWAVAALALLGLGAHLANGIPDIEGDRRTATQGVVGRLGRRWATLLCVAMLMAAAALVVGQIGLATAASVAVLAVWRPPWHRLHWAPAAGTCFPW